MSRTIIATYRDGAKATLEGTVQGAHRWIRFSAEDLEAAQRVLSKRLSAPRFVCWWSQQSAENAIKGALP